MDGNEAEPEHSFEEVVVRGFLVLALLTYHLHLPPVLHQIRMEVPSLGGRGVLRGEGKGSGMGELDKGMAHTSRDKPSLVRFD